METEKKKYPYVLDRSYPRQLRLRRRRVIQIYKRLDEELEAKRKGRKGRFREVSEGRPDPFPNREPHNLCGPSEEWKEPAPK